MAIIDHLIALGTPVAQAGSIVGTCSTGLTSAGTGQSDALLLSTANNSLTTVASTSGVKLPACSPGSRVYVYNGGAHTVSVYGQTGEAIASGSANAAFSVASNKGCDFVKMTGTLWGVNYSA